MDRITFDFEFCEIIRETRSAENPEKDVCEWFDDDSLLSKRALILAAAGYKAAATPAEMKEAMNRVMKDWECGINEQ